MKIKTISMAITALVAALFIGCESSSNDANPNWSNTENVNGEEGGVIENTDGSVTVIMNVWEPNGSTQITLPSTPDVNTVVVKVKIGETQLAWTNAADGSGNLIGSSGIAGSGKVDGNTVTLMGYKGGMGTKGDSVTVTYTPKE